MTTLVNGKEWRLESKQRDFVGIRPKKSSFAPAFRRRNRADRCLERTESVASVSAASDSSLVPANDVDQPKQSLPSESTASNGTLGEPKLRFSSTKWISGDDDANLRIYLQEISETPLLKPEEEAALAGRIKVGDERAREMMITANLRLVVKIAKDFIGMGLPLLDMINEGNLGLMRAVDRFDPTKGAKLSTYAAWWIKQSIRRGLANQGKTIRLPVHLVDLVAKMRRASMKFHEEVGRDPSDLELAGLLGMTRRRVTELWDASQRTVSLDAPLGDDDDNQLADVVPDELAQTAFQEMERGTRQDMIRDLLGQLEGRELWILQRRFGLDGNAERTLEDIGREVQLTRERIRQIENQALKKMKRLVERRESQLDPDLAPYQEELVRHHSK